MRQLSHVKSGGWAKRTAFYLIVMLLLPLTAMAKESLEGLAWIDYTSIGILTTGTLTPPKVHVPDDYKGKIQYYVINNDNKVVDCSSDGKSVKLTGAEGAAVVGVFVPTDDKYERIDFKFTVYAAKKFFTINSKSDWDKFCKDYKGEFGVVYLNTDLDLGNKDYVDEFTGLFDGQGHTINLTYTSAFAQYYYAPFYDIKGNLTIKNLNIEGTATTDDDNDTMAGLISCVKSDADVTIDNCRSALRTTYSAPYYGGEFSGFVNRANGKTTFRDCSFVGKFNIVSVDVNYIGGYVSKSNNLGNVKFVNCFSDVSGSSFDSYYMGEHTVRPRMIGYFIGRTNSTSTKVMTNCYAVDRGYDDSTYMEQQGVILVSVDSVADGIAAFKLKAGRTGNVKTWVQTIGTDTLPMLEVFSPKSKEVFHASEKNLDAIYNKWTTLFYPANVTLPENVEKYVVMSVKDGKAHLSQLNTDNTADVPMLLYCADNIPAFMLPEAYFNKKEQNTTLRGIYEDTAAVSGDYIFAPTKEKFIPAEILPQWQCYIANGSGEGYELDTSNSDVYVISSKESWNTFKTLYNGVEVKAYLDCDLTLTKDDEAMESFKGTFDGQGHSIVYDFVTSDNIKNKHYGLFYQATGTVRNLNITGRIYAASYFSYPLSYPAPLAFTTHGTENAPDELNIENCHSDVSYYVSERNAYTGAGFLIAPTYATVNFKDCSFTGTFASPRHQFAGGFVVQQWQDAKINLTNCFSDVHIPSTSAIETDQYGECSPKTVGYFVGKQRGYTAPALTNCYAHNSSTLSFGTTLDGQTIVSDSLLKTGVVTYKLQAERTGDDNRWAQTLGTDTLPQLQVFAPESKEVFHADETKIARDYDHIWTTLYYPADVVDLHEDIKQLVASRIENDTLYANVILSDKIPANTPVLLYSTGKYGMPSITLPACYYNKQEQTGLLAGVYDETPATGDMRGLTYGDETTFSNGTTAVPAFRCYLNANDHDAYKIANEAVLISSKEEWNLFKTLCNNFEVNARLTTDLTIETTDEGMQRFKGTFDGQGHTLTLNYIGNKTGESSYIAPFIMAEGTIKNLKITGELMEENAGRLATNSMLKAPLVIWPIGTLNIENCHSNVAFKRAEWQQSTTKCLTGFVMYNNSGSTLNFKDCSFTGSSEMNSVLQSGGFVANQYDSDENTLTFTNCYSDMTGFKMNAPADDLACDYFVGKQGANTTVTITNSYARQATLAEGKEVTNVLSAPVITDSEAASGETTYKLNAGRSGDDAVWMQTIGTDTVPQLALFAKDSKEVYEAAGGDYTLDTSGWGTLYYPADVTLADGVKAYTVGDVEQKTVGGTTEYYAVLTAVEGNTLPAYTPAILCSLGEGEMKTEEKTISLKTIYYNDDAGQSGGQQSESALLCGVLVPTEAKDGWYIMQNHDGDVAFWQVDADDAQPIIPAFRCALSWIAQEKELADAKKVNLQSDRKVTGISNILEPLLRNGATYDLEGRKVKNLQKGQIYIKNGRKFIVK